MTNQEIKFAFFDGDNVGVTIEKNLTMGNVTEAKEISNAIKKSLDLMEVEIQKHHSVEIIIIGGDDLLLKFIDNDINQQLIKNLIKIFEATTSLSMSCGVGDSINEAIYNLHLAKLFGKAQVYTPLKTG